MAMVEKHVKTPAPSGPEDAHHGSMRSQELRDLVSGRGGAKALPATRRGGHDHRQGPPASEGESAIRNLGRQVKK